MKHYIDLNGDSGIAAYEYTETSIRVQFKTGKVYQYSLSKIGASHFNAMVKLADSHDGLNAYINNNPQVSDGFDR